MKKHKEKKDYEIKNDKAFVCEWEQGPARFYLDNFGGSNRIFQFGTFTDYFQTECYKNQYKPNRFLTIWFILLSV